MDKNKIKDKEEAEVYLQRKKKKETRKRRRRKEEKRRKKLLVWKLEATIRQGRVGIGWRNL